MSMVLLGAWDAAAQDVLSQTFISRDGRVRFDHPAGWEMSELTGGNVVASFGDVGFTVAPLWALEAEFGALGDIDSSAELLRLFIHHSSRVADFQAPETSFLSPDVKAARSVFTIKSADFSHMSAAFALGLPVGETYVVVVATAEGGVDVDTLADAIYPILMTLEITQEATLVEGLPVLQINRQGISAAEDRDVLLPQLEAAGLLLAAAAVPVYEQDFMTSGLTPGMQIDPQSKSAFTDFAMGALISFRPRDPDANLVCALLSRITLTDDGDLADFLAVAVTDINTLAIIQVTDGEPEPFVHDTDIVADFYSPQHLVYVAANNQLSIFVNGQPVVEQLPLPYSSENTLPQPKMVGVYLDSSCVMTGVWAVSLPSSPEA